MFVLRLSAMRKGEKADDMPHRSLNMRSHSARYARGLRDLYEGTYSDMTVRLSVTYKWDSTVEILVKCEGDLAYT
jgi:hypothetical protein